MHSFHPKDPSTVHCDYVPLNLPTISPGDVGKGWRRVALGEPVKTTFEVFRLQPRPCWVICAYFTKEKLINKGFSTYRAPASVGAWRRVLKQLPRKYLQHLRGEI